MLALFVLPLFALGVVVWILAMLAARWWARGGAHLLLWWLGLTFLATGSVAQVLPGLLGWNETLFRVWYLLGTVLVIAWLGQGTVYLVARRRLADALMVLLVLASAWAGNRLFAVTLEPVVLASGVAGVDAAEGFDPGQLLGAAAALLRDGALDDAGAVDPERLSPLAASLTAAAAERGAAVPTATVEATWRGIDAIGLVEGRRVALGRPQWLLDEGVEIDVEAAPSGSHTLYLAMDGRYAGRLRLRPARTLSSHAIVSPGSRLLTAGFVVWGLVALLVGAGYGLWRWRYETLPADAAIGCVLLAIAALVGVMAAALPDLASSWRHAWRLTAVLVGAGAFLIASRPGAVPPPPTRHVTPRDPGVPAGSAS